MCIPFQPFGASERAQPGTVFHSKLVERGTDSLTEQFQPVQLPDSRQHMGGVSAPLPSGPEPVPGRTVYQQAREGELFEFAGDQPGPEFAQH